MEKIILDQKGDLRIYLKNNGKPRELVKIKSDNPTHAGYYTTYRDEMGPDDEEYFEMQSGEKPDNADPGIQVDTGNTPTEPISTPKRKYKKRAKK